MKAALIDVDDDNPHERIVWYCPGCRCDHGVPVPPHHPRWTWNGSLDAPTLTPSVTIIRNDETDEDPGDPENPWVWSVSICHSFIRDGRIEFLPDCTHDHAGKTVEMRDY